MSNKRGIPLSTLRKLERNGRKVTKLKLDLKYFETCLELRLCPQFLKFKPPNLSVYKKPQFLYQTVLERKLKETLREFRTADKAYCNIKQLVFSKISCLEQAFMIEKITESLKSYAILISEAHQTKLINLWRKERLRSPGIITNLSNKALTIAEQDALRFGLNHHILPRKFQENNVKANIERFIHGLKQKTKIKLDDDFKDDVKFLFKKFASNAERARRLI